MRIIIKNIKIEYGEIIIEADDLIAAMLPTYDAAAPATLPPTLKPYQPRADELARGRQALVQLFTLWSGDSAFPLDAAEKITHNHGEFLLLHVDACGGLRAALVELRAAGELPALQIATVPTFLSMLSAIGIPVPAGWFSECYDDDPDFEEA